MPEQNLTISNYMDDGAIEAFNQVPITFQVSGEGGAGSGWFGEYRANNYYAAFFRFQLTSDIPSGATVTEALFSVLAHSSAWNWSSEDALRIYIEDASNASQCTSMQDHPFYGSNARALLSTSVRWPLSGGLVWVSGSRNQSNDISSIIQALVDKYGGLSAGDYVQLWITKDVLRNAGSEVNYVDDYLSYTGDGSDLAKLSIEWSEGSGSSFKSHEIYMRMMQ